VFFCISNDRQVHEFGHALMTKRLGGQVDGIILWPLGGFAFCGPTDDFLLGDLKVAIAGPMTHVPMALLWWGIYVAVKEEGFGMWPNYMIYLDTLSSSPAG
jgi:Zn-dependent protease